MEALGEHGTLHHGVTIGDGYVYSHESWSGSAQSEYVRLGRPCSSGPGADGQPPGSGYGLHGLTAEEGIDRIAEALKAAGLTRKSQLSTLARFIAGMRSSWRMTAAWQGHDERASALRVRGFAVWDRGPLGYWRREPPAEPVLPGQVDDTTPLRLVRIGAKEIWQLMTDVLPETAEFAAAPHPG